MWHAADGDNPSAHRYRSGGGWGRIVVLGPVARLAAAPLTPEGGPTPELDAALSNAKLVTVLELVGFFVIFTCMILMRFGL